MRGAWAIVALLTICAARPLNANAQSTAVGPNNLGRAEFGTRVALGDFDGDQRPDLATVSVDQANAHSTDYLIRVRFSTAPEATIGLTAKGGGLDLSPRDVNGDEVLDLVVSTATDSHVVAVLLNDGHGNFRLAEPGTFAVPTTDASTFFHEPLGAIEDLAARIMARSGFGDEAALASTSGELGSTEALPLGPQRPASAGEFCRYLGRSPPWLPLFA